MESGKSTKPNEPARPRKSSKSKATTSSDNQTYANHEVGLFATVDYLFSHKSDGLMWISRLGTVIFTFLYIFPFFQINPHFGYYNALLTNLFTSFIRLHQRLPRLELSRRYLALMLQEDSCHYVFFSLIFFYAYPSSFVLYPIFLFALLHSSDFSLQVLKILGFKQSWLVLKLSSIINEQAQAGFRLIAFSEIVIMLFTIITVFTGHRSVFIPFIYYRFLTLRYQSRRNPYSRLVFADMRLFTEVMVNHPSVPELVRKICHKIIAVISRLAPAMPDAS